MTIHWIVFKKVSKIDVLFASFEQELNKKPITIHNNTHLKFGFSVERDSEF